MYCSQEKSTIVTDPKLQTYEKQKIVFDERPWQAAWGQSLPSITTVEYVPAGGSIDHWHELVTSQSYPEYSAAPPPKNLPIT